MVAGIFTYRQNLLYQNIKDKVQKKTRARNKDQKTKLLAADKNKTVAAIPRIVWITVADVEDAATLIVRHIEQCQIAGRIL